MNSIILWRMIFWILLAILVIIGIMLILTKKNLISLDTQEVWVNIFKDISTVIIIPIILGILQSDTEKSQERIEWGFGSIGIFIFLLIWCNYWPIIRKKEENMMHKFSGGSYTKLYINSDKVTAARYEGNNESKGAKK